MQNIVTFLFLFLFSASYSQIQNPVKWKFSMNRVSDTTAELILRADMEKGWHIYSQQQTYDLIIPVSFSFTPGPDYETLGKVTEPKPIMAKEPALDDAEVRYFENSVTFRQKIKILSAKTFSLKGTLEYQTCNDRMCLPPQDIDFSFKIEGTSAPDTSKQAGIDTAGIQPSDTSAKDTVSADVNRYHLSSVDLSSPAGNCGEKSEDHTLWGIFLLGILGGFIALLTPCVFPMIPLTVSFFTKGNKNSKKGTLDAITYGFFIMLIYFLLSVPFHLIPGIDPEILNQISTNTWLNIFFFLVFLVFAISFFGYFEITLPSKWAGKADAASGVGGMFGIFFMALTLAIVSFSCTGPILGTLLAGTLNAESAGIIHFLGMELQLVALKLSVGMTGFGLALGLPFAVFALFPGWLQSLPKSGGWLNAVKVVLGFVEVALAIKFLSNADLVEQWGLLKRETFFALWFLCAMGLTLYIFGKIKFPHDSPVKKISPSRWMFAATSLVATIYLFPGMIGKNWWSYNFLSGFPPPKYYSYFKKEHEIKVYTDFTEGMTAAKKENKPVMIDFTGWACVNCRKMEDNVWVEDAVKAMLNEKYIVISLYVDERTLLPDRLQHETEVPDGEGGMRRKKIRTVGDQWSTLQALTFASNSQPYYVLLNPGQILLGNPIGYTPDVNKFMAYLNCGLDAFRELQNKTALK